MLKAMTSRCGFDASHRALASVASAASLLRNAASVSRLRARFDPPSGSKGGEMLEPHVRLKDVLRSRHWQVYRTFCREYDNAAKVIDSDLVGTWPSRAQLHRWLKGDLKGLPYPDHCRVLERMLAD